MRRRMLPIKNDAWKQLTIFELIPPVYPVQRDRVPPAPEPRVRITDPFTKLLRTFEPYIKRCINSRLYSGTNKNEVDDMAQLVAMRLYRNRERLPTGEAQIRRYIQRTANSVIVDFGRKSYVQRERLYEIDHERDQQLSDVADPHDPFRQAEVDVLVARALTGLSPEQRQALTMAADGYTDSEIAKVQGVPENTARTRIYYGRQKARKNCPDREERY